MTQQRRNRHRKRRVGRRAFLIGLGGSVSAALTYYLLRSIPAGNNAEPAPSPQAAPNPALPSGEWRAAWVSYLEFAEMDFSSESAFRADAAALMDNCLSLGLNTVIAQVRPFGDALYRSSLFPWSHLCTGVQGQDPGFDPLDVLLTEAHARGLSLEAWVNPYRLRSSVSMPPVLAENSLLNTHPEWVCTVNEGAYLNPAIPEAADYVVQGVAELVQNYAVDGIHTAISRDRQVSFRYFDWTAEGQRAFRRDGAAYVTDPVALCVDRYYYLVAYDALRQDYRHYRVDRMADLTVLDSPRFPLPRDFDLGRYVRKIFDMYGGASVTVRLRLHRSLINPAMDRFGSDAHIRPDGPDHVALTAPVEAGPTFYGWLFQFGDKAELLSPADVRRDFADYCRRVLARYDA